MRFKIKDTYYEINFSFFALIVALISIDKSSTMLISFISAALHEAIHIFFLYTFSSAPKRVRLSLFGADILQNRNTPLTSFQEIIINISAPVFNILMGCLFLGANAFINENMLNKIGQINVILGIFNILPFYNLFRFQSLFCIYLGILTVLVFLFVQMEFAF